MGLWWNCGYFLRFVRKLTAYKLSAFLLPTLPLKVGGAGEAAALAALLRKGLDPAVA